MASNEFSDILSAGRIGSLTLNNRIIMTPMGSNLAQEDGHCGERIQRYYEERARGGAGMITLGVAAIAWPIGAAIPNQVAISADEFIPGLLALTDRVHKHGCKAAIQLQHAGKVSGNDVEAGRPMLVPSVPAVADPSEMLASMSDEEVALFLSSYTAEGSVVDYKVATQDDIDWLIGCFADSADRAVRAGFDGIELHAGHGYILSEFVSPHTNQRDDKYGGSVENRSRLLAEVIQAVKARAKKTAGTDFPVWCRLDAKEFRVEGGINIEDAKRTAEIAEQAGADAIHVSAYGNPASGVAFTDAPLVHKPCGFVDFAVAIKQKVSVPVIAVGRIEPQEADSLIRKNKIDFVAMGRKLLADPHLPNKLREQRAEDIRPCIYCYTCVSQIFIKKSVMCAVNPTTGMEQQCQIVPAAQPKKVLIIGGGPAGMEAARVAALRGHKVSLYEKSQRLGGAVFFASLPYAENGRLTEYLEKQVRGLPVEIHLGAEVNIELIRGKAPDAIILAVGAKRDTLPIPGARAHHVFSGDDLRALLTGEDNKTAKGETAKSKLTFLQTLMVSMGQIFGFTNSAQQLRQLSKLWMPLGKNVVIIGGGLVGLELAEFLAERGRRVTVLEEGDKFGLELSLVRRWRILDNLKEDKVELINNAAVESIDLTRVHYRSNGDSHTVPADNVVLASGATANTALATSLAELNIPLWQVGDCSGVSYIQGAIHQGAEAAREV